jgi:hypothetical protein
MVDCLFASAYTHALWFLSSEHKSVTRGRGGGGGDVSFWSILAFVLFLQTLAVRG